MHLLIQWRDKMNIQQLTFEQWVNTHYPEDDICFECNNTGNNQNIHNCDCEYCEYEQYEECDECSFNYVNPDVQEELKNLFEKRQEEYQIVLNIEKERLKTIYGSPSNNS